MILAHLVGDQTLPNLLAALALRPACIIHVTSDAKRFAAPIRNLERALALSGLKPVFHNLTLPSANPSPAEVTNALSALPPDRRPTVLNLTGGTKLMFLGGHTWAELNHVPSFYVDTAARAFTPTSSLSLPPIRTLTEVAAELTLESVLTAHGVPSDKLQGHTPTDSELAFGHAAASAWTQDQACSAWVKNLRDAWLLPNGYSKPDAWRTGVAIPPAAAPLAEAAVTAGWSRIDESGKFVPQLPPNRAGDQATRSACVAALVQNLEGGWFELHVAALMLASGRFHSLSWSVESPDRSDLALGETDIVALDRHSLSPLFVSCKSSTSFEKPLEHIFSLRQRATHFGGTFAQAVLCVSRLHYDDQEKNLRDFCRAANVRLLLGEKEFAAWLAP